MIGGLISVAPPRFARPATPEARLGIARLLPAHCGRPQMSTPARLLRGAAGSGRCGAGVSCHEQPQHPSKGASGQAGARLWGAEKRSARGPARSANRHLTRRSCLSGVSAANAVSSATWPRVRASQGSLRTAQTAPAKRSGLPGRAFAAPAARWRAIAREWPQWAASRPVNHAQATTIHAITPSSSAVPAFARQPAPGSARWRATSAASAPCSRPAPRRSRRCRRGR